MNCLQVFFSLVFELNIDNMINKIALEIKSSIFFKIIGSKFLIVFIILYDFLNR